MENILGCVLIMAITFPLSFYAARGCLCGVIRLVAGAELGAVPRRAIGARD
jgi:hypothetical protein